MVKKKQRVRGLVLRILNSRFSVASWILNGIGLASGLLLLSILYGPVDNETLRFMAALPFLNAYVWTYALIATAITKLVGMAFGLDRVVHWGAFTAFVLWIFGLTAFIAIGNTATVVLIAAPLVLFNIYLFLATSFRDRIQV